MNPEWKLNFFLFNIEGYGEFFSGITPCIVCPSIYSFGIFKFFLYIASQRSRFFYIKIGDGNLKKT